MKTKAEENKFFFSLKSSLIALRNNQTFLMCCFFCVVYLISGYFKWIEIGASLIAIGFMFYLPLNQSLCLFAFMHSFTKSNLFYDSCFMITIVGFTIMLFTKYIIGLRKNKYSYNKKLVYIIIAFYIYGLILTASKPVFYNTLIYLTYLPIAYFILEMREEFNINSVMKYMLGGLITSCSLGLLIIWKQNYQQS